MHLKSIIDSFPFGKAPFILLVVTLFAGGWLLFHPIPENVATLRFWTFAKTHYNAYQQIAPVFEAKYPGTKLDIQLVHGDAVTTRLRSAFWADLDVPDLVEVEISSAGSFFRGPIDDVGFVDLTSWLKESGYYDRIVQTRFAPYSNRGHIFGMPHDVHPVMLAYRRDIFEAEGVDVSKIETWDDFIREGRRLTRLNERYMIELSDSGASNLEMFLFQRDGGYFDADGNLIMDDETAVKTVTWYIPLVAGPNRIGSDLGSGRVFTQAIEQGYFLSFICPDWRSKIAEVDVPRMAGKMALMPLPAVEPGARRTSTWGGTMLGITKRCENKDLAWELAKHMYLDPEELAQRFRDTNILPPLRDAWDHEAFKEPRPYWSNQPIGTLYAELADQVPSQYTSPFIATAKDKMSEVISACAAYYRAHGDKDFETYVRTRLKQAAEEVRTYMRRDFN